MLLSGFTFIRNATKFDFPIRECVESMLPIVDELIINVGRSEDDTEVRMKELAAQHSKIKLIFNVWDDSKTKDGLILSEQTNLALAQCQGRWALYLQADEALHEDEIVGLRETIEALDKKNGADKPEGIRLRYLHFYGGYSLVQARWNWYPTEVRVLRNNCGAVSFGDAQTFRKMDGTKLTTVLSDTHIFHYGHARAPETMAKKNHYFHRFWHGDRHSRKVDPAYRLNYKHLVWYWGKHPKVYADRVRAGEQWSPRPSENLVSIRKAVILTKPGEQCENTRALTEKLSKLGINVEQITSIFAWFKFVYRNCFSRSQNLLIDFNAAKRHWAWFPCWAGDMMFAFGHRIAVQDTQPISDFRLRFYNAVCRNGHDNSEGFRIPPQFLANQLLKTLGLSVSALAK